MTTTEPTPTPDPSPAPDPTPAPDPSPAPAPDPAPASPVDAFAALKTLTPEQRAELREALDEADGGTADTEPVPASSSTDVEQDLQVHEVWRQAIGPDGTRVLVGPDITDANGDVIRTSELPAGYRLLPPTPTP